MTGRFIQNGQNGLEYRKAKAYESVGQAQKSIDNYLMWYNQKRPHSSLSNKTPDEAYFEMLPAMKTAV